MNKIIKRLLLYTIIAFNIFTLKSSGKEESVKEIIFDYYDNDYDIDSRLKEILKEIDKECNIDYKTLKSKDDIETVLVFKAVIDNHNLTEDEKKLCYNLLPFYLDYDSLDRYSIYERLSTLDIVYSDKKVEVDTLKEKGASYFPDDNEIICYKKEDIVIEHELLHASLRMEDFPKAIKEGLISELTMEYFYDQEVSFSSTYYEYMALINSLTYLIDNDTLIELASYNNYDEFKEILLDKGSIKKDTLDNIMSLLNKDLNIKIKAKIIEELEENYSILRTNEDAKENLEVYNLYDSSIDSRYYFNKTKIKEKKWQPMKR